MTTTTFPLTRPIDLSCRVGYGSITVHAEDGLREASVTVTPRDAESDIAERVKVDMRGTTLIVHGPKPRSVFELPLFGGRFTGRDAVDLDVTVPSGTPIRVASLAADVAVHGRSGSTDIAGGAASTQLDEVDGDLRMRYGSGPARVQRVTGSAMVKSGAGEARFGEVAGPLDMACGTGNLDVGIAHGSVRLRTGSGQASIGVAENDVELVSGSGGLSVGLRAGQSARLDVVTGGGRLHSDLPVEDTPPRTTGPTITIRARTGSGDVRIFRAEQPVPEDKIA